MAYFVKSPEVHMAGRSHVSWEEDFEKCVNFHGHACPGLALGYRAGKAAMAWLGERRAPDEEIVAIVETDACGSDAIQVLTGCTFGKGNFIYKDYGKHAFSLLSRASGKGVRLSGKAGAFVLSPRHHALFDKIRTKEATNEELNEFWELHREKCREVLERHLDELFSLDEVTMTLPPRASVTDSRACDRCGEPVMASKLVERKGKEICRACIEKEG